MQIHFVFRRRYTEESQIVILSSLTSLMSSLVQDLGCATLFWYPLQRNWQVLLVAKIPRFHTFGGLYPLSEIHHDIDPHRTAHPPACLNALAPWFGTIKSTILLRENPPSCFYLQSILLVLINHVRQRNNSHNGQMLYSNLDGGRGQGWGNRGRFRRSRHGGLMQERNQHYWQEDKNSPREFGKRGSHSAEPSNHNNPIKCRYCRKLNHYEEECRKKQRVSASSSR